MIGKIRRPSKTKSVDWKLPTVILVVALAVSAYLLADYSDLLRIDEFGKNVRPSFPSVVTPVEILSSADSLLGCDFRSNRDNVIYGGKIKFSWNCSAADRCSFDGQPYGPAESGIEVVPENTRRYILECSSGDRTEVFAKSVGVFEFVIREISSTGETRPPGIEEKLDSLLSPESVEPAAPR